MSKEVRIYVTDLLERIARIEESIAIGEDAFRNSTLHQDAVIRNFEVIGEIVKRLDTSLTQEYSDVRWSAYAGFRDILIHQYDKVLLDIVWKSAVHDLPLLKSALQAILTTLDEPPSD
ncbi:MAG: DUF86 domain-containing protein [Anaerolineae bacterium]|nr:DUF86 domain-containing protein [Anaerolineae bacterium]